MGREGITFTIRIARRTLGVGVMLDSFGTVLGGWEMCGLTLCFLSGGLQGRKMY